MDSMSNKPITIVFADSTCDLSNELIDRYDVHIIPLHITLGEKNGLDRVDFSTEDLISFVDETSILPKTSAPSPSDYLDAFRSASNEGKEILYIGLGSGFSTSINNAQLACEQLDCKYRIVDSENLSAGIGLLVIKACELAGQNKHCDEIADTIEALVPKVETSFVIDALDYLYKGGRCSGAAVFGSNLLKIKPCIEVSNGEMIVGKKYQGSLEKCFEKYIKDKLFQRNDISYDRIILAYSVLDERIIKRLESVINTYASFHEILLTQAGATITSHCGPNCMGILFIRK